jgi:hypothetical protein
VQAIEARQQAVWVSTAAAAAAAVITAQQMRPSSILSTRATKTFTHPKARLCALKSKRDNATCPHETCLPWAAWRTQATCCGELKHSSHDVSAPPRVCSFTTLTLQLRAPVRAPPHYRTAAATVTDQTQHHSPPAVPLPHTRGLIAGTLPYSSTNRTKANSEPKPTSCTLTSVSVQRTAAVATAAASVQRA